MNSGFPYVCGATGMTAMVPKSILRQIAQLADTKTAASLRPLSGLAGAVIPSQPRVGDVVFPSSPGETPIVGLSEDATEDRQAGWTSRRHHAAYAPPVLPPILAITSRLSPACSATRRTRSPAGGSTRRCRIAGSSRCRGEWPPPSCVTPVARSAPRWISGVGRNHLFIGVFVTHKMAHADQWCNLNFEPRRAFSASLARALSRRRASPEGRMAPRSRAIPQSVQPR